MILQLSSTPSSPTNMNVSAVKKEIKEITEQSVVVLRRKCGKGSDDDERVTFPESRMQNLMRSYSKSFKGFAAKLTSDQRYKIAEMEELTGVWPESDFSHEG
ncbi:hypothetical protein K1719_016086 [Acacia pycnantha]|nr:hypothetical protein K1719_016086 [Acacia pycnantha]